MSIVRSRRGSIRRRQTLNPLEELARHAIEESRKGKTISLDDYARGGRRKRSQPSLLNKWREVVGILPIDRIRSNADYDRAVRLLKEAMATIGRKRAHPLLGLVDILEMRLKAYDDVHVKIDDVSGAEMLRFLMDQHGLRQGDLPELGSQSEVSKILAGKRKLTSHHIAVLAKRFRVKRGVFLPDP